MSEESATPAKGIKAFCPNLDLLKWVKEPTHYPQVKPMHRKSYSIKVGENGDMPFFASPPTNKRLMN